MMNFESISLCELYNEQMLYSHSNDWCEKTKSAFANKFTFFMAIKMFTGWADILQIAG